MISWVKPVGSCLAICAMVSITSCAIAPPVLSSRSVDGKVFNPETGEPIGGAIVVLTWRGMPVSSILSFDGHSSPSLQCYHVETAITDSTGHYHVAAWQQLQEGHVRDGLFQVQAYKKGYRQTKSGGSGGKYFVEDTGVNRLFIEEMKDLTPDVEMRPFSGTPQERAVELNHYKSFCTSAGHSSRNLLPFINALTNEMSEHAEIPLNDTTSYGLKDYAKNIEGAE